MDLLTKIIKSVEEVQEPDSNLDFYLGYDLTKTFPDVIRNAKADYYLGNIYFPVTNDMSNQTSPCTRAPNDKLTIHIPEITRYSNVNMYYKTLAHEIGHFIGFDMHGIEYAYTVSWRTDLRCVEELTAELFSLYLLDAFSIADDFVRNVSVDYLKTWYGHLTKYGRNIKSIDKTLRDAMPEVNVRLKTFQLLTKGK